MNFVHFGPDLKKVFFVVTLPYLLKLLPTHKNIIIAVHEENCFYFIFTKPDTI